MMGAAGMAGGGAETRLYEGRAGAHIRLALCALLPDRPSRSWRPSSEHAVSLRLSHVCNVAFDLTPHLICEDAS